MIVAPELAVFDEARSGSQKAAVVLFSPHLSELEPLQRLLDETRYAPLACATIHEVMAALRDLEIALVVSVCDRADSEALSLCWQTQGHGVPVVLLARRGADATDRMFALEAGADDLMAYPPNGREFAAVIHARTRRMEARAPAAPPPVKRDHWVIESDSRSVLNTAGGRVILSRSEWALLEMFVDQDGHVLDADAAVARLDLNVADPSVGFRMAVSRRRRKLGDVGASRLIRCVRGEGYVMDGPVCRRRQPGAA